MLFINALFSVASAKTMGAHDSFLKLGCWQGNFEREMGVRGYNLTHLHTLHNSRWSFKITFLSDQSNYFLFTCLKNNKRCDLKHEFPVRIQEKAQVNFKTVEKNPNLFFILFLNAKERSSRPTSWIWFQYLVFEILLTVKFVSICENFRINPENSTTNFIITRK